MHSRAFAFVDAEPDVASLIVSRLRRFPGVESADRIRGPHSIVVRFAAGAPDGGLEWLQDVPGVRGVVSCIT